MKSELSGFHFYSLVVATSLQRVAKSSIITRTLKFPFIGDATIGKFASFRVREFASGRKTEIKLFSYYQKRRKKITYKKLTQLIYNLVISHISTSQKEIIKKTSRLTSCLTQMGKRKKTKLLAASNARCE